MCLTYSETLTSQFVESTQEDFICYKIFKIENGNLYSPYRDTDWGTIEDNDKMTLESNRTDKEIRTHEKLFDEVERGIHVFVDRETAVKTIKPLLSCSGNIYIILPVICKKIDLVAAGTFQDFASMVFMKVIVDLTNLEDTYTEDKHLCA